MELKLVKTTYADLTGPARCVLALQNKPFFFIRCQGVLYMNADTEGSLTEAIQTMWKYDLIADDEIMAEIDTAYDHIAQTAGSEAARQANAAWMEAAEASRRARAKANALEWITKEYNALSEEAWDEIYAAGYDSDFVQHGLFRAFCDLRDQNPDSPRYREYFKNWAEAAFVYGFQLGRNQKISKN